MKNLICICCPNGCHLEVDENNNYAITGNACPRGEEYGKTEAQSPVRVVTSSMHISGAAIEKCPVKTDRAIPKSLVFDVAAAIKAGRLSAPVHIGDIVVKDVCGTGANVVVCKECGINIYK